MRAALVLALASILPGPSQASVPYFGLDADHVRLSMGGAYDVGETAAYSGEIGFIFDRGHKHFAIGPVAGLAVGKDLLRISLGPHFRNGLVWGPEAVYRRVGEETSWGGAVYGGIEIPIVVISATLGLRLGGTSDGVFGDVGLQFALRLPAGPRAKAQLAAQQRAMSRYPRCDHDGHCVDEGEYCYHGTCQPCRDNAHCSGDGVFCITGKCERMIPPEPISEPADP